MKSCRDCIHFRTKKRFSNSYECFHPEAKSILYLDIGAECEHFEKGDEL